MLDWPFPMGMKCTIGCLCWGIQGYFSSLLCYSPTPTGHSSGFVPSSANRLLGPEFVVYNAYFFPTSWHSDRRWVCSAQPMSHPATANSYKCPYIKFSLTVFQYICMLLSSHGAVNRNPFVSQFPDVLHRYQSKLDPTFLQHHNDFTSVLFQVSIRPPSKPIKFLYTRSEDVAELAFFA